MENVLKTNMSVLKYVSKMISDETGCNIIICDQEGEIIEATIEERIGKRHMGSILILSGETDEAVITKEMEEEYTKIDTDTRRGYNYVITVLGQRVGSLGVAGEPVFLKPIVRIAAKTIGFYISQYLEEKEKNKILQKMAKIAEDIAQQYYEEIDYHIFAKDLLHISRAKYVFFDIYNPQEQTSTIVAVAGKKKDIRKMNELLGMEILGLQRKSSIINSTENKGITYFDSIFEFPSDILSKEKAEEFHTSLEIGQVCSLEIAHDSKKIGRFILLMPTDKKVINKILLELYALQVGQLLMRVQAEAALKKSETELRKALNILDSFWEHSPNPISIIDNSGKVILISKSGSELLGFSPDELKGKKLSMVFSPSVAQILMERVRTLNDTKKTLYYCDEVRISDDVCRHYDSWIFPIANEADDTPLVGLVALDVTNRKINEEQFRYLSHHDALTDIYNRTYFEKEVKRLNSSEDYPITMISLDADGLKIINDTMGHDKGDVLLKNIAEVLKYSLRDSDILARIGGDEFAIILPKTGQAAAQEIASRIKDRISVYNNKNSSLPIIVSLGLCTVEEPGQCLEDVLKRADERMYHNKLFNKESSRSQIFKSWIATLAERDHLTQEGVQRIITLCTKIGERKNLSSRALADLALLVQAHDLGKIGVPDRILFKPGPLTAEEWEIMCQHSEKGYRMAMVSPPVLKDIADLILKHHERWDGKGYPLALREDEIPIECRILAVVDSYDVMISGRPYKKALSKAEAVAELERGSGSQFDPEIVKEFLEVLGEQK